jgi:hypothetical protein
MKSIAHTRLSLCVPVYIGNRVALGACQSGCIGIADSASLVCILERENSLQSVIGKECNSNNSCVTGECKVIGDQAVCADVQKSSLLLVFFSGENTCIHTNLLGYKTVSYCTLFDASCKAQCVCADGFYGTDCTLSVATFQNLVSLRELLCSSILESTYIESATAEELAARTIHYDIWCVTEYSLVIPL